MYRIFFLLLDNPEVRLVITVEQVKKVEIMAPYVALHYLPFMKGLYADGQIYCKVFI